MRIGLMGFGKAGRAVASVLLESPKVELSWVIRRSKLLTHRSVSEFLGIPSDNPGFILSKEELNAEQLFDQYPVDMVVDFSSEFGIDYYGKAASDRKIAIISAISRYPKEKIDLLLTLSKKTQVLYSPNITIGINFLIIAAKILKNIAPYTDIAILEEHYRTKPEVSGTAKIIAHQLDMPEDSIKSIRAGGIVSLHEILFGFPYQTVRLKHEAITREAYGNGILFIVENLQGKPIGFYKMEDLLLPYFKLTESEEDLLKTRKTPWWHFWE
ncbi:MAG: dihydrodipicolinate reductase [Candidatus Delongbacteria bacterium]|nr:dihydrodipicolinate reductase [Candidatus Delongbacteria bacterium]